MATIFRRADTVFAENAKRTGALLLTVLLSLSLLGCSSASKPPDNKPEDYGLTLYESPNGDWECHLPSAPERSDADTPALSIFLDDSPYEQWISYGEAGLFKVIRVTGSKAQELSSLMQNDADSCWKELEAIGTMAFVSDTGWAPAFPNAFKDEEFEVPDINRYETADKAFPTMELVGSYTFKNHQLDGYKDGYWGVLGTYNDAAFYLLVSICDSMPMTRAMQNSFELLPDGELTPSDSDDQSAAEESSPSETQESSIPEGAISWQEASSHIGETVTIYGPVVKTNYESAVNGRPTYLDIGVAYPDKSGVTVVVWGEDRPRFSDPPETLYEGKTICVTGELYVYNGQCDIKVTSPNQIQILQ